MNDAYGNALERMLRKAHQESASPVAGYSDYSNEVSNHNKCFILFGILGISALVTIGIIIGIAISSNNSNEDPNHPNPQNDTSVDNLETYNLRHSSSLPLAGQLNDKLEDA